MPTSLRSVRFCHLILLCMSAVAAVHSLSPRLFAQVPAPALPELKADDALRPTIEKGLRVQALRDTQDTSLVQIMIQVDHPPFGMGFDVALQTRDRMRFVGPVAWSKQEIKWWAFDIDVSPGITALDVVFTPSAKAAAKLKHRNSDEFKDLESIWTGTPIVIYTKISSQALGGMLSRPAPSREEAREDQIELLAGDDMVIEQVKRGGDLAQARKQLQRRVQEKPTDATAWYNLGCLTMASDDWPQALDFFAKVQKIDPDSSLAEKSQRQLRRIGGCFAFEARHDEVRSMVGLGVMYQRGWGPAVDRQAAKRWFRNAANAGNAEAMVQLAVMYDQELAGGAKKPKAEAWYRQQVREMYRNAADLGNEEAKKWLATHE